MEPPGRSAPLADQAVARALAASPIGTALTAIEDGCILFVNDAFLASVGRQREDVLGRTTLELGLWPSGERRGSWLATLSSDGVAAIEMDVPVRDGSVRRVMCWTARVVVEGRPLALTHILPLGSHPPPAANLREERLRLALEASNEGLWDYSHSSQQLYVSPRAYTLLGFGPEEFPATVEAWQQRLSEDSVDVRQRLAAQLEDGDQLRVEVRMRTKAGGVCYVLLRGRIVTRDARGRPDRVLGTLVDITERRLFEAQLRASEERFRTLLESSPDMVFLLGADERVLYLNPAAACALGGGPQDWIGRSQREIFQPTTAARHGESLQTTLRTGQPFRSEAPHEMGGKVVWIETLLVPMPSPDGSPGSVLGIARDITERRAAEAELRRAYGHISDILDSISDGFFSLDAGLVLRGFNHSAERLLGRAREDVLGRHILEAFPEFKGSVLAEQFAAAHHDRLPAAFETHFTVRPYENWYDVRIFPIQEGVSVFFRVTTDRKRLEEQLVQAQKMEAIGRLAGGVAHDFNNQLAAILGYDELILRELPEEHTARPRAEQIRRAAERAATLTRQLLAFARRQVLEPQVLDLNVVVAELEDLLRRTIGEHIALVVELDPELGSVKADRAQVEQAILNMAVNAHDAMPGGGRLTLETRNVSLDADYCQHHLDARPGEYVLLAIADSGSGMDAATLTRLFEPFFTTKEVGRGTGLGLSMVYGFVTQSGGHVAVESAPGQGSRFSVYLPRTHQGSPQAPWRKAGLARVSHGSETILVAEDDSIVRRFIVEVLSACGYRVIEAASGPAALRLAESHEGPIHLLLSDVVMPGHSGVVIAERLVRTRPALRVLLISGYPEGPDGLAPVPPGLPMLSKPFPPDVLVDQVRAALDGARAPGASDS